MHRRPFHPDSHSRVVWIPVKMSTVMQQQLGFSNLWEILSAPRLPSSCCALICVSIKTCSRLLLMMTPGVTIFRAPVQRKITFIYSALPSSCALICASIKACRFLLMMPPGVTIFRSPVGIPMYNAKLYSSSLLIAPRQSSMLNTWGFTTSVCLLIVLRRGLAAYTVFDCKIRAMPALVLQPWENIKTN